MDVGVEGSDDPEMDTDSNRASLASLALLRRIDLDNLGSSPSTVFFMASRETRSRSSLTLHTQSCDQMITLEARG